MKLKSLFELNVTPGMVVNYHLGDIVKPMTISDDWRRWGGASIKAWSLNPNENVLPTKWKDITDAEKGALLLAFHNGEMIQRYDEDFNEWVAASEPQWFGYRAYRVKPIPTVIAMEFEVDDYKISFNKIDGVPDCASVKMVKI